jgi:nucleotide-binding universal stress UspA family protein
MANDRTDRKVLVAIDFSEPSRSALAWAVDYARSVPSEIHLLHVAEDPIPSAFSAEVRARTAEEIARVMAAAEQELTRMSDGLDGPSGPAVRVVRHVAPGSPGHEIARVADKIGADLLVMGTHGRTGLPGLLLGSVAKKVVRHAACPVVCVKPGEAARSRAAA